jgi:protein TonB
MKVVELSAVGAIALHAVAFGVWPEYVPKVYKLREEKKIEVIQMPEFSIPPPPKEIARPQIPLEAESEEEVDEEETITETSLDIENLPPAPPPPVDDFEEFLPFDTMPVPLHIERPKYPDLARRADLEGSVDVMIKIDEKGRVVQARVVKSTAEVFNDAAIEAAYKCRFKPALQRDVPVPCRISIPFRFSLRH